MRVCVHTCQFVHKYSSSLKVTDEILNYMQSELSEAKEIARQSEAALREKKLELEQMSTSKQQEGGSLRTTLQAKELELTKAMDKLLQVKFIVDLYIA